MITPSAAQAAGESTEQKIARLERELAAAQAEIAALRVNAEKWRSYEMSKNQANKECGK